MQDRISHSPGGAYRRRILWCALTVSLLAHLCAIWWWRNVTPAPAIWPSSAALEVRVVTPAPPTLPVPAKQAEQARTLSTVQERAAADRKPRTARSKPRPPLEPWPAVPHATKPEPEPAVALDDLISSAKRDVGAIDRALRNDLPARKGLLQVPNNTVAARLERNIAAAAVPRGTSMQEITLNDGRRYTKVVTSSGTYCVWGRDPRPSAVTGTVFDAMQRTTTCPR